MEVCEERTLVAFLGFYFSKNFESLDFPGAKKPLKFVNTVIATEPISDVEDGGDDAGEGILLL